MGVPGPVSPHLVVVESGFVLGLLEAFLDSPPGPCDGGEFSECGPPGSGADVVRDLGRIRQRSAGEEPVPAPGFEPDLQVLHLTVSLVRGEPGERDLCALGAFDHPPRHRIGGDLASRPDDPDLRPGHTGGQPRTFSLPELREIEKIAKSTPTEHDLPLSTWSLSKLAEFLITEGVVYDISHEGLRVLFREEGVSFQKVKTWKRSRDPVYAVKKALVEHLYAIADGCTRSPTAKSSPRTGNRRSCSASTSSGR